MRVLIELNNNRVDMKNPINLPNKQGERKEDLLKMVRTALSAIGIDKEEL